MFIVCLLLPHYCGQLENQLIVFFIFRLDFLSVVVVAVVIVVAMIVVIVAVIVYFLIELRDFFKSTKPDLNTKNMKLLRNPFNARTLLVHQYLARLPVLEYFCRHPIVTNR